jgi:tRNA/rRNA methyltransferase
MGMVMVERCDVVLVGTQNAENLGGVARLMENFAAGALVLVAPRVRPEDPRALVVGRMARGRLEGARVTATLDQAVGEAAIVVGFSARRGASRPMVTLRELRARLGTHGGRVALVFGPEDAGLAAEDVERCDLVATIELPGELASLNLTQAVAITLWELARAEGATRAKRAAATRAEIEALVEHAARAIPSALQDERRRVHLRRVLVAAGLEAGDVRALHGILQALDR